MFNIKTIWNRFWIKSLSVMRDSIVKHSSTWRFLHIITPLHPSSSFSYALLLVGAKINIFIFLSLSKGFSITSYVGLFPSLNLTDCLFTLAQQNNTISLDCHLLVLLSFFFGKSLRCLSTCFFIALLRPHQVESGQLMENVSECVFCFVYVMPGGWQSRSRWDKKRKLTSRTDGF